MLLKQNSSKLNYYCEVNLYFDDDSEKHIRLEEKDRVKISYKSNANTYIETGVITKITPITINNSDGDCSYGCSCGCGCKSTAIISLDVSKEYNSEIKNIIINDILDIVKLDQKDGVLPANRDNISDIIANAKYGDVIELETDVYDIDFVIDKPITIKGAKNGTSIITGNMVVTSPNVAISGCTFNTNKTYATGEHMVKVECTGPFTFTNNTVIYNGTSARCVIMADAKGIVDISNNTFIDPSNASVYNWVEIGLNKLYPIAAGSKINSNTFIGKIRHNQISMYTFDDGAEIEISGNTFDYSGNALRISNTTSAKVNFSMYNNTYNETDPSDGYIYAGLLFFQDYAPKGEIMDFTKMNVYISNLIGPEGNKMLVNKPGTPDQVYYVYDDQDGIVETNQPNITLA